MPENTSPTEVADEIRAIGAENPHKATLRVMKVLNGWLREGNANEAIALLEMLDPHQLPTAVVLGALSLAAPSPECRDVCNRLKSTLREALLARDTPEKAERLLASIE